jgi:hypothetical protein
MAPMQKTVQMLVRTGSGSDRMEDYPVATAPGSGRSEIASMQNPVQESVQMFMQSSVQIIMRRCKNHLQK